MNKKKISISGELGSGKSVVSQSLKKKLGYTYFSAGGLQRELAKSKSMTTLEMNKFSEMHREIDDAIDKKTETIGKTKEHFIFDSRLAWHFIPDSFKIFLFVSDRIAAKRIFEDTTRGTEKYKSVEHTLQSIRERRDSEKIRFKKLYNLNMDRLQNYNLIVDTSLSSLSTIIHHIFDFLKDDFNDHTGKKMDKHIVLTNPFVFERLKDGDRLKDGVLSLASDLQKSYENVDLENLEKDQKLIAYR